MRHSLFSLSFIILLTNASPIAPKSAGLTIPLTKRESPSQPHDTLTSLHKQLKLVRRKYAQRFRAYHRNTGSKHPLDPYATELKRDAETFYIYQDSDRTLWQGKISVGTPPSDFTVDIDSGSSDTYLPGSGCTEGCSGHNIFDPATSSTSRDCDRKFSLSYGDGSTVDGELYTETITIGQLTVLDQALGIASYYSEDNQRDTFEPDGLLGGGYQSISEFGMPPLFQSLYAQGKLSKPVYGLEFSASSGSLSIGISRSEGMTYVDVTQEGFWQINIDAITVASIPVLDPQTAIIDSGTTVIMGPADGVDQLYAVIPSAFKDTEGLYTLSCDFMPTISFTFGAQSFPMSAEMLSFGPVAGSADRCYGSIVKDDTLDFWILGDHFLQNVYTELDFGMNRVGFARAG